MPQFQRFMVRARYGKTPENHILDGSSPISRTITKTPLTSEPLRFGLNGVFIVIPVVMRPFEVVFSFSRLNEKSANLKLKEMKTGDYELLSLSTYSYRSECFKA